MRHVEARAGAYADSVTLMQVTAQAQAISGVQAALVAMATELNLGLLEGLGMQPPDRAGPNDMLVAIQADDGESLATALAAVDNALRARPAEQPDAAWQSPRTTFSAARRSGTGLALISVPGQLAFAEAVDALDAGCDVMIFSDNVPVDQEIWLKERAAERGLLVLGPDCGTAIVAGIGLGFSHSIPAGPIGLVAASGTGAQQIVCLLDAAGAGVSAVLGVGGRDLSAAVGGRSARAALAALDADPTTELIVLVSKPPAERVAAELIQYAATLATPVQFALIGPGQADLTAATEAALRATGQQVPAWPLWPSADMPDRRTGTGALRGLFAGGTLCDEAMVIAAEKLGPVYSNIPLRPQWRLDPRGPAGPRGSGSSGESGESGRSGEFPRSESSGPRHIMIDFGDDELTAGRPHPMIDQRLRLDRFAAEAADPATAVIMLDVVLGHGAHPDPVAEIGPAIAAARAARPVRTAGAARSGSELAIVVSLVGARSDPQGLTAQATALAAAGAHVFASNAQAARFACDLVGLDQSGGSA